MKVGKYFLIALIVILIDQAVKLLVYYNMELGPVGEIKLVGDIFKLHYTLNEGMAFGITIGHKYGKLILTLFRLVAVGFIGYYIVHLTKNNAQKGLIICVSMVLGGALGNVLDSIFYGVFLNNTPYDAPMQWFHGQVIDMFYLDIYEGYMPEWIPLIGGDWVSLWPIFNVADAAIFVAVAFALVKQKTYFPEDASLKEDEVMIGNEDVS